MVLQGKNLTSVRIEINWINKNLIVQRHKLKTRTQVGNNCRRQSGLPWELREWCSRACLEMASTLANDWWLHVPDLGLILCALLGRLLQGPNPRCTTGCPRLAIQGTWTIPQTHVRKDRWDLRYPQRFLWGRFWEKMSATCPSIVANELTSGKEKK